VKFPQKRLLDNDSCRRSPVFEPIAIASNSSQKVRDQDHRYGSTHASHPYSSLIFPRSSAQRELEWLGRSRSSRHAAWCSISSAFNSPPSPIALLPRIFSVFSIALQLGRRVSWHIVMALLPDLLLGFAIRIWLTVFLPTFFITYWVVWIVYARTLHPLSRLPGPFWPSISRTWLMYRAYVGDLEIEQRKLHEEYGPLLRVAPGT
jgi:hypothetical protein